MQQCHIWLFRSVETFFLYVRVYFYLAPECAALCMDVLNSSDNLFSIRGIPAGFTHSRWTQLFL